MPELRWILLGLGVLFCIGLWWWETRRQRQAASSSTSGRAQERFEPALSAADNARVPTSEPPVVEHEYAFGDDGLLLDKRAEGSPEIAAALDPAPATVDPVRIPSSRIEPIITDSPAPAAEPPQSDTATPPGEMIVSLRLAAPPLERFEGRALVQALRAAGLEYGQFSIFHKCTPAGEIIFSVASLVEPGTFDLEQVDGRRFPGITLFVVLPNPIDASAALEEMIVAARRLAEQLSGTLQDQRGAPLSSKRLVDLRGDVTTWQLRTQLAAASSAASQQSG